MKTTLTLILLTFICLSSKAQDLKNEISVGLTSLYISPISNHTDRDIGGMYPLSGLRYTRHLSKFGVFASYNRYISSSTSMHGTSKVIFAGSNSEIGDEKSRLHKESAVQLGIANVSARNKTFSPLLSASFLVGEASTKRYENDNYHEAFFFGKPATRDIRYFGINSSLGLRYNINKVFHIDLSTEVGIVKTTGTYKVFIDHPKNPTVFEYDELAIVPMFTLAEISVGVNF